jgi:hypothetical protein
MTDAFAKWKNPNGTYNGAAMFAELTGLDRREIEWMARRMKELKDSGVPKGGWTRIVKEESAAKPWLATPTPQNRK